MQRLTNYGDEAQRHKQAWRRNLMSTEPFDVEDLRSSINLLYETRSLGNPMIVVCDSPWQVAVCALFTELILELAPDSRQRFIQDLLIANHYLTVENALLRIEEQIPYGTLGHPEPKVSPTTPLSQFFFGVDETTQLGDLLRAEFDTPIKKAVTYWRRSVPRVQQPIVGTLHQELWEEVPRRDELLSTKDFVLEQSVANAMRRYGINEERVNRIASWCFANLRFAPADRLPFASFIAHNAALVRLPEPLKASIKALQTVQQSVAAYSFFERFCFISQRPCSFRTDAAGRLHNESGPALAYRDSHNVYRWHGVRVPAEVIMLPERITVRSIESERNIEVRRIMISLYGESRYLMDSQADLVASDEFGELYSKNLPSDEPLVMVKVINSTPNPDGSVSSYFLRVPPTIASPREAVAWTFGLSELEYTLDQET